MHFWKIHRKNVKIIWSVKSVYLHLKMMGNKNQMLVYFETYLYDNWFITGVS